MDLSGISGTESLGVESRIGRGVDPVVDFEVIVGAEADGAVEVKVMAGVDRIGTGCADVCSVLAVAGEHAVVNKTMAQRYIQCDCVEDFMWRLQNL